MIDFTPYPNVGSNSPLFRLRISIDTIRITPYKKTIFKYLSEKGYKTNTVKSYSKISSNVKKLLWNKETTSLKRVVMPNFKNIIITTPDYINQKSNYKKCILTAFGLSQPKKPIDNQTKENLKQLFNKFSITSFDLSIDSQNPLNIKPLSSLGTITDKFTTQYINNPLLTPHIAKICYYNKSFKDNLAYPLYRLELTIKTNGKLHSMFIPLNEIELITGILGL